MVRRLFNMDDVVFRRDYPADDGSCGDLALQISKQFGRMFFGNGDKQTAGGLGIEHDIKQVQGNAG